jgi:hypothetical protein
MLSPFLISLEKGKDLTFFNILLTNPSLPPFL